MNKEFCFHNVKATSGQKVSLIKIFEAATVQITSSTGVYNEFIILSKSGYYSYGKKLDDFEFYYDGDTNKNFYIIYKGTSSIFCTITVSNMNNVGSALNIYNENFNVSSLTLLSQLNYSLQGKNTDVSIEANESLNYVSILPNNQYQSHGSIVIILARNLVAVIGHAIYFMHKVNGASPEEYTLSPIYESANIGQFNLTPTTTGFTATNTSKTRYKILEIPDLPLIF